ncbi:hypothetical protein V7O66_02945 [Methanolobus sp. ZRKC3]|uniref:hypothetical protein n=1 Tax=Methanolobus sp. ZRKC3 TaxID=3125786 RepID=UPI0032435402
MNKQYKLLLFIRNPNNQKKYQLRQIKEKGMKISHNKGDIEMYKIFPENKEVKMSLHFYMLSMFCMLFTAIAMLPLLTYLLPEFAITELASMLLSFVIGVIVLAAFARDFSKIIND